MRPATAGSHPQCSMLLNPGRLVSALLCSIPLFLAVVALQAADVDGKKSFDIKAGDAASTLKQFAQQSGVELLYSSETIEAVKTKAVRGDFFPREVLDRMIDGTDLVVKQGEKKGAFTITRAKPPAASAKVSGESGTHPPKKTEMNKTKPTMSPARRTLSALLAVVAAPLTGPSQTSSTSSAVHEEAPITLTPFEVTASEAGTYRAASTFGGNGISTNPNDVGSALSVVTAHFLRDTGATNNQTPLQYTTNTAVGG